MIILFLIASAFCFTIPGIFLITKSKIQSSFWEKVVLGTIVGFIFFTFLSYFSLILNLQFLSLLTPLVINIISLKQILKMPSQITYLPKIRLLFLLSIFLFGVIGQLLVIAPSGLNLKGDLVFWSSHAHDGSWHIALMEEIKKGYPLQNPIYAGEKLVNYHFFSDIAPAVFSKYFKFSTLDLYFRFFPLFFSILLGAIVYLLGVKLGGFTAGIWGLIFTYFAGSFGYIVTYFKNQTIGGESIFWASQIQSSVGNPPQIASFIIVLAFLYLFHYFIAKKDKVIFFTLVFLAGMLIEFKVYGAVVLLGSLSLVGIWQLIRKGKSSIFLLSIASCILSAILYLPNSQHSASFLIFEPWWFIRTMVVAPDKLNWLDLELRRQTYIAESNWKRVIQLELTAFLIFFFGNLGMRFLGLWHLVKSLKTVFKNYFNLLFLSIIVVSFVLPLLFLQKGVASNTIQFFQYFLLLSGIAAAVTTAKLISTVNPIIFKTAISILIITLAIPTQVALIYSFYNRQPFTKIQGQELTALEFLKQNTDKNSIVLTPPYNKYLDLKENVPDIWDWSDTAFVSAFSARRTYLADLEQVDIMGYDLKSRKFIQERTFIESDPTAFTKLLKQENIDFIYFPKALKPAVELSQTTLRQVYSNDASEVWEVK